MLAKRSCLPLVCAQVHHPIMAGHSFGFQQFNLPVATAESEGIRHMPEAIDDPVAGYVRRIGIHMQRVADDPAPPGIAGEGRHLPIGGGPRRRNLPDDGIDAVEGVRCILSVVLSGWLFLQRRHSLGKYFLSSYGVTWSLYSFHS